MGISKNRWLGEREEQTEMTDLSVLDAAYENRHCNSIAYANTVAEAWPALRRELEIHRQFFALVVNSVQKVLDTTVEIAPTAGRGEPK